MVEKSETGDELYFRINLGKVSSTVEITDSMYADMDSKGNLLGVEWINIRDCIKEISSVSKDYSGVPEIKALKVKFPESAERINKLLPSLI